MEVDEETEAICLLEDEEGGTRVGDIYIPPPVKPHFAQDTDGRRLIISNITNENFKSFSNKVVLGPFHHSVTAIIGPNGCGKSNVIDSLLFVFGFRAQKVRSTKVASLIHNSAKHRDAQSCTVSIKFIEIYDVPCREVQEIEGSEIVITRTAFHNSSSFYTINGRRVQFKEVEKLLKSHKVDLDHNRFLILQGEVESIAGMPPKGGQKDGKVGMLEYLEEIIGTLRYVEPLQKIDSRIKLLSTEQAEKENRCKLAELEVTNLEEPFNEAVQHLKLENEHTRLLNLMIQKQIYEFSQKLTHLLEKQETVVNKLKQLDTELVSKKKCREEREKSIREETTKLKKLHKSKDEKEQAMNSISKKASEIQSTMEATNKRRKQHKSQLEKLTKKIADLKNVPEKNKSEISECEKKLEELNKKKTNLEDELQKNYAILESETKPLIEQRTSLETELVVLKNTFDKAKEKLALVESEMKILRDDEIRETRKYEYLKSTFEELQSNLNTSKRKFNAIQLEVPQLKEEVATKMKQLEKLRYDQNELKNRIAPIKSEIVEREKSMHTTMSNNKVLNALMQQKEKGNIFEILGRLGDLGGIDKRYDVAISTCCGRLDSIIVDTVDTAQKCIEFLKKHDIGRASFVALEKISHMRRQFEQKIHTPENVHRLCDLIRVEDDRLLAAFYFSLRNTLVANDLDQATRISYGAVRYRVVTLSGDIIETSGTMSGGGRTQIRGKMGQEVVTRTSVRHTAATHNEKGLDDLKSLLEKLEYDVSQNQDEQDRLENDLYNLKTNIHKRESEWNKLNINVNSLSEQLQRSELQLNKQKKCMDMTTSDPVQVQSLEKDISVKQKIVDKCESSNQGVVSLIDEIKKKIEGIHGNRVKEVQTKINSTTKQVTTLTNNVSKLKVEAKTSERNCKKVEKQIEDLKGDIKSSEEDIVRLSSEREDANTKVTDISKEIEDIKKDIDRIQKETSVAQKEISELQKSERDLELVTVQCANDLTSLKEKVSNVKRKIPAWKEKLKPLTLHIIPLSSDIQEPLQAYANEELCTRDLQEIQISYQSLDEQLKASKPNLSCIDEYNQKLAAYKERVRILEEITNKFNEMNTLYEQVSKKRQSEFIRGFAIIVEKVKEVYNILTMGGAADLELIDPMDPFSEGIAYTVRPPQKAWKKISDLSGGERTLSSLSLVFALHYYRPSVFYFMDEIDAALDFRNVRIIAMHIIEQTKNAQFVIISLRPEMFEMCNHACFIMKENDSTKSFTIVNVPPDLNEEDEESSTTAQQKNS